MQDGSRKKNQGLNIATNSFSYRDCLYLSKILNEKYGFKTSPFRTDPMGLALKGPFPRNSVVKAGL